MRFLVLLLLSILLLAGLASAQDGQQQKKKGNNKNKKKTEGGGGEGKEEEEDGPNDYEVYEAIQSLRQLTEHETFYELLGVSPSATDDQIGRSFRKLSVKYHPDKHGPGTAKMFKLVQYASTLLRDRKRRARYEWLLHEAPAWHRESVYMARRVFSAGKLSMRQALLFTFCLALLGQLVVQWMAWWTQYGRILASRRGLGAMGEKEVKRIRRKLEAGDAAAMAANNSDYETVMLADSHCPPYPTPLDLFVIALPLALLRKLLPSKPQAETKQD